MKPEEAKSEEVKPQEGSDSKDAEETVSELSNTTRERQSSLSIQSKLRSSTFRQASGGGPLSPGYGFSPDGESAPDIYRKQAAKIDELERENKKLVKDVSDGERRWKKAEDELDDIREAEVEKSGILKEPLGGVSSPDELEKLVCNNYIDLCLTANHEPAIRNSFIEATKYTAAGTIHQRYTPWLIAIRLNGCTSELRSGIGFEILYYRIYGNRNFESSRSGRTSELW